MLALLADLNGTASGAPPGSIALFEEREHQDDRLHRITEEKADAAVRRQRDGALFWASLGAVVAAFVVSTGLAIGLGPVNAQPFGQEMTKLIMTAVAAFLVGKAKK